VAAAGGAIALSAGIDFPVLCPFRLCTGHACPGCGLTRGAGALLRGDLVASVRFHPLAIVLAVQALVVVVIGLRRGKSMSAVLRDRPGLLAVNAAALLATWVLRWHFGLLDLVLA